MIGTIGNGGIPYDTGKKINTPTQVFQGIVEEGTLHYTVEGYSEEKAKLLAINDAVKLTWFAYNSPLNRIVEVRETNFNIIGFANVLDDEQLSDRIPYE